MRFVTLDPTPAPSPAGVLARFLTGDARAHPDVADLRAGGVGALAFVRLPEHVARAELRLDFMQTSARHLAVRRAVAPLVGAWGEVGIEALVFKGFHLAEFVYASPAERSYWDVDLVMDPRHVEAACTIAREQGWQVVWRIGQKEHASAPHGAEYVGHEAAQLRHPEIDVTLDLHRRMAHNTHNRLPFARAQTRITETAWAASRSVEWLGTRIRIVDPRDAVVVGLAVNRGWGSDAWKLKARDYPDFAALIDRYGFTREALLERARELGVPRTLDVFLDRCDPYRGRLHLGPPSWWALRRCNLRVAPERGWVDLERGAMDLGELVAGIFEVAWVVPTVWRVARRGEQVAPAKGSAGAGSDAPASSPKPTLRSRTWRSLRRAIHRSMRFLRVPDVRKREVAAHSAHVVLVRRGFAVGLAVTEGGPILTLDGTPLDARADDAERW